MVSLFGRGFESHQLHPTIIEVVDFQRLLFFFWSPILVTRHSKTEKYGGPKRYYWQLDAKPQYNRVSWHLGKSV